MSLLPLLSGADRRGFWPDNNGNSWSEAVLLRRGLPSTVSEQKPWWILWSGRDGSLLSNRIQEKGLASQWQLRIFSILFSNDFFFLISFWIAYSGRNVRPGMASLSSTLSLREHNNKVFTFLTLIMEGIRWCCIMIDVRQTEWNWNQANLMLV